MIALTRPLVDAGILPRDVGLVVHAVSGYSGGGKQLMAIHQAGDAEPWGAYGFNLAHKHLPEMAEYSGMGREPIFCPAVGAFEQGMVVSVPIHYDQHSAAGRSAAAIQECLEERYAGSRFVRVMPLNETGDLERGAFLRRVRVVELVPIRPRRRGGRRSLRTFLPGVSLRPHLAFNPDTPRRFSTPTDAFQLHRIDSGRFASCRSGGRSSRRTRRGSLRSSARTARRSQTRTGARRRGAILMAG
jgi:hypothetical protein